MNERQPKDQTVIDKLIPGVAKVRLIVTPLRSISKDSVSRVPLYPAGLIDSLMPLAKEAFTELRYDTGENDDYWQKLQENARFSPEDARKLIKSRKLNLSKTADIVLERLLHEQIQRGQVTRDFLIAARSSLATVFDIPKRSKKVTGTKVKTI